jgi:hypothetical protein
MTDLPDAKERVERADAAAAGEIPPQPGAVPPPPAQKAKLEQERKFLTGPQSRPFELNLAWDIFLELSPLSDSYILSGHALPSSVPRDSKKTTRTIFRRGRLAQSW